MCIFCCFLVSTVTAADCCFSHNALFHYAWFLCIFANHILLTHTLACTGTHVGRRTHTPIGEESDGYERAGQANAFGPEWRLNWVIFRNGRDWCGGRCACCCCLFVLHDRSLLALSITLWTLSQHLCYRFAEQVYRFSRQLWFFNLTFYIENL